MTLYIRACACAAIILLAGCQTLNTPQACSQAEGRLAGLQTALPALQAAVAATCGDTTSKACKDASTALTIGQGLVTAEQANVTAQCSSILKPS